MLMSKIIKIDLTQLFPKKKSSGCKKNFKTSADFQKSLNIFGKTKNKTIFLILKYSVFSSAKRIPKKNNISF